MALDVSRIEPSTGAGALADERGQTRTLRVASLDLSSLGSSGRARVGARERMFLTERLSLLLDTGMPLHASIGTLARQGADGPLTRMLEEMNDEITAGASFSKTLRDRPEVFPATYVNLVAAAEAGGFLPVALERLREMDERREELMATLRGAVSYPGFLLVFSLSVVIFVLVVVFPKFEELFTLIRDELPVTTRGLMTASALLREAWIPISAAMGILALSVVRVLKSPKGRVGLDRLLLSTPGLRTIVIQLGMVQLLRVLALSLANGVGMLDALQSSREAVSSEYFRGLVDRLRAAVQEGRGLSWGFERDPLVPDLVKQLIATGDESGNLPEVMHRLADFYEREWRRGMGMISRVAEPAMLLVMGCVIGVIVSSLILPIFKLSGTVH